MSTTHGRERELESLSVAVEAGSSVLVTGPLGVGKTHVIGQFLAARPDQWYVAHVVASQAASTIPFGAVAALLPANGASDAYALLRSATERFSRLSSGRRPLVVVDDVHHLDAASTALVHNLCVVQGAVLLAAARSDAAPPPAVAELLKELRAERVELGPLGADYARQVAADGLGCPVSDPAVDVVLDRSGGNPLFLGELVRAQRAGLPDGLSRQLIDLVRARLVSLSAGARSLMEFVAMGEPLHGRLDIVEDEALAELEQTGLVSTVFEEATPVIRSAHPLYGDVVRAGLSPTTRQIVAKRLATSMRALDRRRGDALRLAGWLLEVGELLDAVLACEAAREAAAWLQTDLADRLIDVALTAERSYPVLMVAGSLRRNAGDVRGAEQYFREAMSVVPGDAERFEVALILAQLYGFYDGNPRAAAAVLSDVAEMVGDGLPRRELQAEAAVFTSMGQYDEALATAQQVLDDPGCDERVEWTALSTTLWAEVQLMRLDRVDAHLARIDELVPLVGDQWPGTVDMVWGLHVTVHLERGDLPGGVAAGELLAAEATRRGVPGGLIQFAIGHLTWLRGDIAGARAAVSRAVERLRRFDSFNTLPMVQASAAILAVADGDRDGASCWSQLAGARIAAENPVATVWRHRCIWWMLSGDDPAAAVAAFVEASRVGRQSSTQTWALLALHDAVLFDGAGEVTGELDVLGMLPVEAPFMDLLVDHARARAAGDLDTVRGCALRFEASGANWYAANAWQAVARAESSDVAATRAATRAVLLAPRTALGQHGDEIAELALSPRQAEVALRAASGATSRSIADDMYVSTRTVDNHLRSVYRRLGVDRRAELAGLLGPPR